MTATHCFALLVNVFTQRFYTFLLVFSLYKTRYVFSNDVAFQFTTWLADLAFNSLSGFETRALVKQTHIKQTNIRKDSMPFSTIAHNTVTINVIT